MFSFWLNNVKLTFRFLEEFESMNSQVPQPTWEVMAFMAVGEPDSFMKAFPRHLGHRCLHLHHIEHGYLPR